MTSHSSSSLSLVSYSSFSVSNSFAVSSCASTSSSSGSVIKPRSYPPSPISPPPFTNSSRPNTADHDDNYLAKDFHTDSDISPPCNVSRVIHVEWNKELKAFTGVPDCWIGHVPQSAAVPTEGLPSHLHPLGSMEQSERDDSLSSALPCLPATSRSASGGGVMMSGFAAAAPPSGLRPTRRRSGELLLAHHPHHHQLSSSTSSSFPLSSSSTSSSTPTSPPALPPLSLPSFSSSSTGSAISANASVGSPFISGLSSDGFDDREGKVGEYSEKDHAHDDRHSSSQVFSSPHERREVSIREYMASIGFSDLDKPFPVEVRIEEEEEEGGDEEAASVEEQEGETRSNFLKERSAIRTPLGLCALFSFFAFLFRLSV